MGSRLNAYKFNNAQGFPRTGIGLRMTSLGYYKLNLEPPKREFTKRREIVVEWLPTVIENP